MDELLFHILGIIRQKMGIGQIGLHQLVNLPYFTGLHQMPDHIPVGYGNYVRHAPVGHHQAQADIAIILRDDIFYPDSCVFRDFLAAAPGLYRRIPKNIIRIPAKLRFLAKLWRFFMSHLVFPCHIRENSSSATIPLCTICFLPILLSIPMISFF